MDGWIHFDCGPIGNNNDTIDTQPQQKEGFNNNVLINTHPPIPDPD